MREKLLPGFLILWISGCIASSFPPPAAAAPPSSPTTPSNPTSQARRAPERWDIYRVTCRDLLGASDDDRAAAAMFYYGYLAAKTGIHVIDVSMISGNIEKVMNVCKTSPNITIVHAFYRALGPHR